MIAVPGGNFLAESTSGGKYWIYDKIDLQYKALNVSGNIIKDVVVEEFPFFFVSPADWKTISGCTAFLFDSLTGSDLYSGYLELKGSLHLSEIYVRHKILGCEGDGPVPWGDFLSKIFKYKEQHGGWSPSATEQQINYFTVLKTVSNL